MLKYLRQQNSNEEKGATMLEAAMVLPFVLFFLFVSIDLFIFAFQAVGVQFLATNIMRAVSTSQDARVGFALAEAEEIGNSMFLKLGQGSPQLDAKVCLCPISAVSLPQACVNSSTYCRAVGGPILVSPHAQRLPGVHNPIPPGESFLLAIRYPVPQLFSFLINQKFYVEAVSIGRVEPRGVGQ